MNDLKDHKQIGQELELFFSHEYAPGAPFWLPKGMIIFKELEKYIRELTGNAGYDEISTPIMVNSQLFVESGHYAKFGGHNMYNLPLWEDDDIRLISEKLAEKETENDILSEINKLPEPKFPFTYPINIERINNNEAIFVQVLGYNDSKGIMFNLPHNFTLKPMNCPEATIVYGFRPRSYKELPLRLAEIGRLHRREKAGEVNGLLRVRQLTMDDAHIFASEDQIFDEVSAILDMMVEFYTKFGFEFDFRLATRPELFAGTEENWAKAEKDLEDALKKKKLKYSLKPADGAFYGPKIDVHIKDSLGREWQLATVQLDFHMPAAFDLKFVTNDGSFEKPVMIHRAILGSFERYIGILTEHYQGNFPLWLSPVQVALLPITEEQNKFALEIAQKLSKEGIRVEVNTSKDPLREKIKSATLQKVPYLSIIGGKEVEADSITLRARDGKDLGVLKVSDFVNRVKDEIDKKI